MPKPKNPFRKMCKKCSKMFIPSGIACKICDDCHKKARDWRKKK